MAEFIKYADGGTFAPTGVKSGRNVLKFPVFYTRRVKQ